MNAAVSLAMEWSPVWGTLLVLWALTDGIVLLERRYGNIQTWPRRFFRTNKH